ncbi:MAG TPA: VanZ family protein [Thermoanaerobaculia bacterium]|nr:VanZ family protein [Thermoanaerobaculia bacterium]
MRFVRQWLPVVLWAALILSASNDNFSTQQSGGWIRAVLGRELPWVVHVMLRKAAHMLEYGVLAFLAWRAHRSFMVPLAIVFGVACTDEWMQSHTAARTGTPWDVVLDCCAAIIIVAACRRSAIISPPC